MTSDQKDIIRIDNIKLLKVISDPIRKQIIDVLYDEPLTASAIADEILPLLFDDSVKNSSSSSTS